VNGLPFCIFVVNCTRFVVGLRACNKTLGGSHGYQAATAGEKSRARDVFRRVNGPVCDIWQQTSCSDTCSPDRRPAAA
jgi:hypothetical protein